MMKHTRIVIAALVLALLAGPWAPGPVARAETSDGPGGGTIQVLNDKSTFLAATGASSATGPLPNLGEVPLSGVTIGSVTLSSPGDDNVLYVGAQGTDGAPEWYPPSPGQDIALGYESFLITLAAPAFALGFDVVEPNTSMPATGGTPADSDFIVRLMQSDIVVAEFIFNAPDDELAFVGVWSDTAFDRALITDATFNPDDEYFGEFYTGTAPGPTRAYTAAAQAGGAVPNGSGVFTGFPQGPALSGSTVAFLGLGSAGESGVYLRPKTNVSVPGGPPIRVVDLTTHIPQGSGTFSAFSALALATGPATANPQPVRVAFVGSGSAQSGVYLTALSDAFIPGSPPIRLADRTTAVPNGTGTFADFGEVALAWVPPNQIRVAFLGSSLNERGVYVSELPDVTVPPNPVRIADTTTAIPAGAGSFSDFGEVVAGGDVVSFIASGINQQGVYLSQIDDISVPPNPIRVADVNTPIPGGTGTFSSFDSLSMALDATLPSPPPIRVAYVGSGAGQQGVYLSLIDESGVPPNPIRVADLSTPIPGGTGAFTGFTAVSVGTEHVALLGQGAGGQAGIYLASGLTKVIATGDSLDGKAVTGLRMGASALEGDTLTFTVTFVDGTETVYVTQLAQAPRYDFSGFFAPVDNLPVFNRVQAGRAIPVKFCLAGDQGLSILAAGYPQSVLIACDTSAPLDPIEQTATAGASTLSYDPATATYTYVWKTEKSWANTCRQFVLRLSDGTEQRANFWFR